MKETKAKTYFFLLFAMICWGLSFVWYKQTLENFQPVSLVLARLIISIPLLLLTTILLKRFRRIRKEDIPYFLLLAFFEPFLYFICESNGMQYVSSTVASIIIATIPIFTSIISHLFINERLTFSSFIGMMLSFVGVLLVIFSDKIEFEATWKGIRLMFLAVFSAIVYGFIIKRVANKYNTLTVVTVQNIIAMVYLLPVFFIVDYNKIDMSSITFKMIIPLIYLAVFASTLAYAGFIQGLKVLGVAKATIFTNFVPVFTAIFAFIFLHEKITFGKIIGIAAVIVGLVLSQSIQGIKKKKAKEVIVDELY